MTSDVFEPTRQEVRHLQARLRGEEDYCSEALESLREPLSSGETTYTAYVAWVERLNQRIAALEGEIARHLTRLPPFAIERDGYIELRPVWDINDIPNVRHPV